MPNPAELFQDIHLEGCTCVQFRTVYLSNIPQRHSNKELGDCFKDFGEIEHLRVMHNEQKGTYKYGFLSFTTVKAVLLVLEKKNFKLKCKKMTVKPIKKHEINQLIQQTPCPIHEPHKCISSMFTELFNNQIKFTPNQKTQVQSPMHKLQLESTVNDSQNKIQTPKPDSFYSSTDRKSTLVLQNCKNIEKNHSALANLNINYQPRSVLQNIIQDQNARKAMNYRLF